MLKEVVRRSAAPEHVADRVSDGGVALSAMAGGPGAQR